MERLLKDFREEFTDRLLQILWDQWTTLGVQGHGSNWTGSAIDPDALLLVSAGIARMDARLFDAILEWLKINNRYINVNRIKRMIKEEKFKGTRVVQAMVDSISTSEHVAKWARLKQRGREDTAAAEPLFFYRDGRPLPVLHEPDPVFSRYGFLRDSFQARGVVRAFRPDISGNLLVRLRALLGVNARCEIMLFLLTNERASPRSLARDSYYYFATISKALGEMEQSGFVRSRIEGRHRFYYLTSPLWRDLFSDRETHLSWIVWARLFSALELIADFLDGMDGSARSAIEQASSLRRILNESVASRLNSSGVTCFFDSPSAHAGESLIPSFITQTRSVLDHVQHQTHKL